jgi:hypothetical protein
VAVQLQHVSQLLRLLSSQRDVTIPAHVRQVERQLLSDQERERLPTPGGPIVMHRPKRDELNLVTSESRSRMRFIFDG